MYIYMYMYTCIFIGIAIYIYVYIHALQTSLLNPPWIGLVFVRCWRPWKRSSRSCCSGTLMCPGVLWPTNPMVEVGWFFLWIWWTAWWMDDDDDDDYYCYCYYKDNILLESLYVVHIGMYIRIPPCQSNMAGQFPVCFVDFPKKFFISGDVPLHGWLPEGNGDIEYNLITIGLIWDTSTSFCMERRDSLGKMLNKYSKSSIFLW